MQPLNDSHWIYRKIHNAYKLEALVVLLVIFHVNEEPYILITISLKFVPKIPIDHDPVLV